MNVATKVRPGEEITGAMADALLTIGNRIRRARLAREMTLQDLAKASGMSASMLSLVERGRVSPSIGSLIVVAEALGVTMSDLIAVETGKRDEVVVRAADQRVIEHANRVVRRLVIDDRQRAVTLAVADFPPNTDTTTTPHSHSGYEYGFVLEGKITVEIDGTAYELEKGDLISYRSQSRHRIWNHTKRNARTLWFNLGKA